jgi:hypothetical protein
VTPARASTSYPTPASFIPQALCVHSGWHWSSRRPSPGARPEYRLAGRWWFRTTDVPDAITGGSGEASWDEENSYGGGMQMLVSTYNVQAVPRSHGRLPYARSVSDIARLSPAAQIFATWLIVHVSGWGQWPYTSRACGLG